MTPPTPPEPDYRGGAGPPLVLLHPMTMTWRVWRPVLPALEAEHDVFAPTLPGHWGAARWPADRPPSIRALADAVERQLDTAGIETPHIAGNSLGGWLALELARRGRARSVVAFSPAGSFHPALIRRMLPAIRALDTSIHLLGPRLAGLVAWASQHRAPVLRIMAERSGGLDAAEVTELMHSAAGCTILSRFVAEVARHGPLGPGLEHGDCPILIAWSGADRVLPFDRHRQPLLDIVPVAEYVVLPGVGHVPMYDDPELVAHTILRHTRDVDGTAKQSASEAGR